MPTLIETINILKEQVGFIIELKESKILNPTLKIVSNIKKFKFILSSRNIDILKDIRKKNKKIPICYNITKAQKFTLSDFIETKEKGDLPIDIDMINLRSNLISREFIKKCQRYNILSLAWDFLNSDTPINDQKKLIRLGINGLLFDDYKNIKTIKEGKESYN
ncbi:MAG: glycerophosphodiester phosphodiesterase family protein [Candidatus Lokiarchaeota archaeon]